MAAGMPTTTRGTTRKPVKMAKFIFKRKQVNSVKETMTTRIINIEYENTHTHISTMIYKYISIKVIFNVFSGIVRSHLQVSYSRLPLSYST
jgi:hypothetical protein